jgi:O-antigen ligase/tetratricopeptide (TPR) repeat protein
VTASLPAHRLPPARLIRAAQEAVLLSLVALSPWAFGAVEPVFEFALLLGLALLLVLTAVRVVLERGVRAPFCPVALILAGLFLVTAGQNLPLPGPAVAALSPNAERLAGELLPAVPELLPGEPDRPPAGWHTLSLDPAATRALTIQLLGLTLFYWVARTQVATRGALRRLAWVLLADGTLLAAVGIAQALSSPPTVLYWTFPSPGAVFGPFVCRNHFPFFAYPCLGLGAGLLAAGRKGRDGTADEGPGGVRAWLTAPLELLQSPRNLWVSAALAVVLAGVALSQSRGGVLALVGAAAAVALWRGPRAGRSAAWPAAVVAAALAVGLVAWLGWGAVERRLGSLTQDDVLREGRLSLWEDALPLVPAFLVCGTGGGTFQWVEPMHRPGPVPFRVVYEHAHNEYLEALVEGGLVRLALTLLLVAVLARAALRAARRAQGRSEAGLVAGAAFGLLAIALHSTVDFGLHIPAVALLAAVVAAYLMAAADDRPGRPPAREGAPDPAPNGWPLPVAVLTASVLVALAFGLAAEGWAGDRVERLRLAAQAPGRQPAADGRGRQVEYLRAAVALRPADGHLLLALTQAELAADRGSPAGLAHLRDARDRSPLEPAAHVTLAAHRDGFSRADPATAYLERACRLQPAEAEFWYACGQEYLRAGQPDPAWERWRRCLALSDRHLKEVLDQALPRLGAAGVCERVMPDRPDLLLAAAELLPPDDADGRRPFLARAVELFDRRTPPPKTEDLYRRGRAERLLGRPAEAAASYRAALAREPRQTAWRYELALALEQQRKWDEAERELTTILAQQPGERQARELLDVIRREKELE